MTARVIFKRRNYTGDIQRDRSQMSEQIKTITEADSEKNCLCPLRFSVIAHRSKPAKLEITKL